MIKLLLLLLFNNRVKFIELTDKTNNQKTIKIVIVLDKL
jgi:hypothetical protein